VINQT